MIRVDVRGGEHVGMRGGGSDGGDRGGGRRGKGRGVVLQHLHGYGAYSRWAAAPHRLPVRVHLIPTQGCPQDFRRIWWC